MLQQTDRTHKTLKAAGVHQVYPLRSEPVFTGGYIDTAALLGADGSVRTQCSSRN
jgi:hypothetical protein